MFSRVGSEKLNLDSLWADVSVTVLMAVAAAENVALASGLPKGVEVDAEAASSLLLLS